MSTERALLAAVCATPDDDLPRLVFADWLDEQGRHVRADFIRSQIELTRLEEWFRRFTTRDERKANGPEFGRRLSFLRRRVKELFDRHFDVAVGVPAGWDESLPHLRHHLTVRRGFIERVDVGPAQVQHLPELFVDFSGPRPEVSVCGVEYHLAGQGLRDPFSDPTGWEYVTSLRPDEVYWTHHERPLSPDELGRLAPLPLLRLTRLDLRHWEMEDAHAAVLAERFDLPALRALDLKFNQLTPTGVWALSESRWWAGLHELALSCSPPVRELVEVLTAARIPGLRSLGIGTNHELRGRVGDQLYRQLVAAYPNTVIDIT